MARLVIGLSISIACVRGLELTTETWNASTKDKTVFVKFFTPWCAACQSGKPAWDELMDAYENSQSVVVAEVDCPAEKRRPLYIFGSGDDLCSKNDVKSYPSLLYGKSGALEKYTGQRDISSLLDFSRQTLGATCGPANLELCDQNAKKMLNRFQDMKADSRADALAKAEEAVRTVTFREWTVNIQKDAGTPLGLGIKKIVSEDAWLELPDATDGMDGFKVTKIEDGAVKVFNAANPMESIRASDRIVRVNNAITTDAMKAAFKDGGPLEITVQREGSAEAITKTRKESGLVWLRMVTSSGTSASSSAKTEL